MNLEIDRIAKALGSSSSGPYASGLKGVEKESLRVSASGSIAATPHPAALGSALTHPRITTDYSEALLELVTGAYAGDAQVLAELEELHQFVYRYLDSERLWVASMPCVLSGDDSIPIAQYGSSNVGRMKHIYRVGLGFRYGRMMQAIAGIHFNYSPPEFLWSPLAAVLGQRDGRDFRDQRFMSMLRALKAYNWLIAYLFGASPAICKSFLPAGGGGLEAFDRNTWFYPHGTSLRLSDIGYSNRAAGGLRISYNSLAEYVEGLTNAISTPHPSYARIGTHRDGEWLQLNANVLQIENEYYSFVRPKRIPRGNEKRTRALARKGIEYLELRSMDLDPWAPEGLDATTLNFLEVLALGALLADTPPLDDAMLAEHDDNLQAVARRGREPGLCLHNAGEPILLADWAQRIMDSLDHVASLLDADADSRYSHSVAAQRAKIIDAERTPSARVLADMRDHGEGYYHFAMRRAEAARDWYLSRPLDEGRLAEMDAEAATSLAEQARIEAADSQSFEDYLADYFESD